MPTMASGSRMPRSSVNFSRGRILPRATPVRSGTRHSISVTRCSLSHCSRSAKLVRSLFFSMGVLGAAGEADLLACAGSVVLAAGPAERLEQLQGDGIGGGLPLGVPLHAEREALRAVDGERLDHTVGRAGLHPQARGEPVDGLAVHA